VGAARAARAARGPPPPPPPPPPPLSGVVAYATRAPRRMTALGARVTEMSVRGSVS
jgi:hypothetical protein